MSENDERPGPARLGVLFSVIVVDLIGFGIVVPILPFWSERYGANGLILATGSLYLAGALRPELI